MKIQLEPVHVVDESPETTIIGVVAAVAEELQLISVHVDDQSLVTTMLAAAVEAVLEEIQPKPVHIVVAPLTKRVGVAIIGLEVLYIDPEHIDVATEVDELQSNPVHVEKHC